MVSKNLQEIYFSENEERKLTSPTRIRLDSATAWRVEQCPLLETIKEMNIDPLYGIDPVQGGYDMECTKREIGDTVCLWGGVNAHVTLEHEGREEVRDAVRRAISTLAPRGEFILSSVGRIYSEVPTSNIRAMIETWRELSDYPKNKPKIPNVAI